MQNENKASNEKNLDNDYNINNFYNVDCIIQTKSKINECQKKQYP